MRRAQGRGALNCHFDSRRRGRPSISGAGGFTLYELVLVTVVVGILAMILAPILSGAKERAAIATTKRELRQAMSAIEIYVNVQFNWPTEVGQLESVGYAPAGDFNICQFDYVAGSDPADSHVDMEGWMAGAKSAVTTRYPDGEMVVVDVAETSCAAGS